MTDPVEDNQLPFEEQSNIIYPANAEKKNGNAKSEKEESPDAKTEKKDKKTKKTKNGNDKKPEAQSENSQKEKRSMSDAQDCIPFSEIIKQNQFKEFMKGVEKKSEELRSNIVSQLSEVFKIFDIDHDGIISENDLRYTYATLGETISEDKLKKMINESSKPLDFDAFVELFEDKEMEFDPQFDLVKAFSQWDEKNTGLLLEERFKFDLQTWGDRFSERDTDRALEEGPIYEENGQPAIDYVELCANLCGLQNVRKTEMFQEKCTRNSRK